MGSVILFNAARMQAIEDGTVTTGLVDGAGHLILSRHDGTNVDAGLVKGTNGAPGAPGSNGSNGTNGTNGKDGLISAGMIIDWPSGTVAPSFAVDCNGQAISRSIYNTLWGLVGTKYGAGDGSTTFNIPNLPTDSSLVGEVFRNNLSAYLLTTVYTDLPSITLTAASDGSKVRVDITQIFANAGSGADRLVNVQLLCDGVVVSTWINNRIPLSGGGDERYAFDISLEHTPSAGTHTWKVQALCGSTTSVYAYDGSMVVSQVVPANTKKIIVVTDQGISPTIIPTGSNLALGMVVGWPGVAGAPLPPNTLELNGQSVSASTYSGLAALFPTWVVGANLILPDLRGQAFVGYLAADTVFGVLGSFVGEKTHLLTNGELPPLVDTSGFPVGVVNNTAASGSIGVYQRTGGPSAIGGGLPHNNIQPSYVGRWLIIAADGAGEYSPTVQSSLTSRVRILENQGFRRILPSSIVVLGTPGTVTTDANNRILLNGCYGLSLNGIFSSAYLNYLVILNLYNQAVGDQGLYFRYRASGVDDTSGYTAGYLEYPNGSATGGSVSTTTELRVGRISTGKGNLTELTLGSPFDSTYRSKVIGRSTDTSYQTISNGMYDASAKSHDGFTLYNTGGTSYGMFGSMEVYAL